MSLLTFRQDLTWLKPDLQQSGSGTSQAMCHKIQIVQTWPQGLFKIHSPQSNSFMNTDYKWSQEFLIFAKRCTTLNNKTHNLSWVLSLLLEMSLALHYFPLLHRWLPCSEKPSRNSCHESNTPNPNLPSHFLNTDFCFIFKSVWGNTVSKLTRI
jgi:hypothetical protein